MYDDYGTSAAAAGIGIVWTIIWIAIAVVVIIGVWKVFEKAGKPGWAAIIPIYNYIILLEIIGKPVWWVILLFIPIANIIVLFIISFKLAEAFGKSAGFGIGLVFLPFIFYPILGFGDAEYQGPPDVPAM